VPRIRIAILLALLTLAAQAADRRILLIAGPPSHGPLAHEQNAAVLLLEKLLKQVPGVALSTNLNGWPADTAAIEKADAIFLFCDGSRNHLIFQEARAAAIQKAMDRGAGLMLYHYAVEPPEDRGHEETLGWIGGFFKPYYSVNPTWEADFAALPKHPVTRGVVPFRIRDEWYYNMRFREGMTGVTPILRAIPPKETLDKPDGIRSGNPDVRSKIGQPQTLAWAYERPNGGRGFGFTGGHFHLNLGDDNFRKIVLNAIVWTAKVEVPANGVASSVSREDLMQNLDPKPARPRP